MRNIVTQHCLKQSLTCNIVAIKHCYILFPKKKSKALRQEFLTQKGENLTIIQWGKLPLSVVKLTWIDPCIYFSHKWHSLHT